MKNTVFQSIKHYLYNTFHTSKCSFKCFTQHLATENNTHSPRSKDSNEIFLRKYHFIALLAGYVKLKVQAEPSPTFTVLGWPSLQVTCDTVLNLLGKKKKMLLYSQFLQKYCWIKIVYMKWSCSCLFDLFWIYAHICL